MSKRQKNSDDAQGREAKVWGALGGDSPLGGHKYVSWASQATADVAS